jgi:hypothetical protein
LGEKIVRTAELHITGDDDFVQRLTDIRVWLDERRFEPSTFTYLFLYRGMKIRVSFANDDEAGAFADEFGGSLHDDRPVPAAL